MKFLLWRLVSKFWSGSPKWKTWRDARLYLTISKYFHPYIQYEVEDIITCLKNSEWLLENVVEYNITNTGILQIYTAFFVYSYPTSIGQYRALLKSSDNYLKYREFDQISGLLNYSLVTINSSVRSELLQPANAIDFSELSKKLHVKCNSEHKFSNVFSDMTKYYNAINVEFFYDESFFNFSSVIHGDLTPDNIMKNSLGELVVIDLDRLSACGPTKYDLIHYEVELKVREGNKNWLEIVEVLIGEGDTNQQAHLKMYVFYRVYLEHQIKHSYLFRLKLKRFYKKYCGI